MENQPTAKAEAIVRPESVSRALSSGRLAEYVTGLKLDDPALVDRLIEDQQIVRTKYGLPRKEMRIEAPAEYERALQRLAEEARVRINQWSECGELMQDFEAEGIFFAEKQVAVDIDRSTLEDYIHSLNVLAHELVHALQHERSPRMPVEQMEYEAYVAEANVEYFKTIEDYAERVKRLDQFFRLSVGASVRAWYAYKSKVDGVEAKPEWDDPKFFAERDTEKVPEVNA